MTTDNYVKPIQALTKYPAPYNYFVYAGNLLILFGIIAYVAEVLDASLLIYFGDPYGWVLGTIAFLLGFVLITIATLTDFKFESDHPLYWYVAFVDEFSDNLGYGIGWLTTVLVIVVFTNVVLRYVFGFGLLGLQDASWYLFGVIFMIGAGYTLKNDRHVRVDVIYVNLPPKVRAWVNLLGSALFLLPFCYVGIDTALGENGFLYRAWEVQERSPNAGGLAAIYLIKAMIPIGFALIALQGLSMFFRALLQLIGALPLEKDVKIGH